MNRPCRRALLAPLLAVVAMLLGLSGTASAAFNPAATEAPLGNFLLWEYEASLSIPLELADPSREIGMWVYDGALGVPVYVRQNPWTFFDPLGLYLEVTEKEQGPVQEFFGEDNVTFSDAGDGKSKVELGEGALNHLNAYKGDGLFKGVLGAAASSSDFGFSLKDTQAITAGIKSARQTRKELVRSGLFETRYVENADAFYAEMIRTGGWNGGIEQADAIMEGFIGGMAEMVAWGAAGELLALNALRAAPAVARFFRIAPKGKPSGASSLYVDTTRTGSRYANRATDVTAANFQSNLVSSGYKVIKTTAGKSGPVTVLSNGTNTYTVYTRASTGASGAQLTDSVGNILVKISLK